MTNRCFNFDKFRVCIRLTVKSTAGHSRITWAEWQTYKGRITQIFGEYTWRPSLLRGITKLCPVNKGPQVMFWSRRTSQTSRVIIAMLNEQEAPKWPYEVTIKTQILRNETTEALNHQGCRLYYTNHNIYIGKSMYITRARGSGVIRPKMSNIPRPAGLLLRLAWVLVLSNINEVVWPVVQIFADTKGPSQGGDNLCISVWSWMSRSIKSPSWKVLVLTWRLW